MLFIFLFMYYLFLFFGNSHSMCLHSVITFLVVFIGVGAHLYCRIYRKQCIHALDVKGNTKTSACPVALVFFFVFFFLHFVANQGVFAIAKHYVNVFAITTGNHRCSHWMLISGIIIFTNRQVSNLIRAEV